MAPTKTLVDRRVRVRRDDGRDDLEDFSDDLDANRNEGLTDDSSNSNTEEFEGDARVSNIETDDGALQDLEKNTQDYESDEDTDEDSSTDLKNISFGALAKAQAQLGPPSRRRKNQDTEQASPEVSKRMKPSPSDQKPVRATRTSKHAPTIQTSRKAVTRHRDVFSPPPAASKSRDPRFDPAVMASSTHQDASTKANKNYAFLTSYQASEILDLKAQIKRAAKSRDGDAEADFKRQLMSLESKVRNASKLQREAEILAEHKREERKKIASGEKSKPYYLKESDVKRKMREEREGAMSKKQKDKAEVRKRKREKGKESKGMPRFRRAVEASG